MWAYFRTILAAGLGVAAACAPSAAEERVLFASVGDAARAPIGWIEFCADRPSECKATASNPRHVALTSKAWAELVHINKIVNDAIKPITDLEHYGVIEKWTYPDDGYGDCEDYVLLKRRMLIAAKWPTSALLITVVRDKKGDGHSVLTVKTDQGEFILDNQNEEIVAWLDSGYRFVKRQSQADPNLWVALEDPRPAPATATSR